MFRALPITQISFELKIVFLKRTRHIFGTVIVKRRSLENGAASAGAEIWSKSKFSYICAHQSKPRC